MASTVTCRVTVTHGTGVIQSPATVDVLLERLEMAAANVRPDSYTLASVSRCMDRVIGGIVCLYVMSVRAVKQKRLELSTSNLAQMIIKVRTWASMDSEYTGSKVKVTRL